MSGFVRYCLSLMDSDATATLRTDGTLALDMLGMMLMYFVLANL